MHYIKFNLISLSYKTKPIGNFVRCIKDEIYSLYYLYPFIVLIYLFICCVKNIEYMIVFCHYIIAYNTEYLNS